MTRGLVAGQAAMIVYPMPTGAPGGYEKLPNSARSLAVLPCGLLSFLLLRRREGISYTSVDDVADDPESELSRNQARAAGRALRAQGLLRTVTERGPDGRLRNRLEVSAVAFPQVAPRTGIRSSVPPAETPRNPRSHRGPASGPRSHQQKHPETPGRTEDRHPVLGPTSNDAGNPQVSAPNDKNAVSYRGSDSDTDTPPTPPYDAAAAALAGSGDGGGGGADGDGLDGPAAASVPAPRAEPDPASGPDPSAETAPGTALRGPVARRNPPPGYGEGSAPDRPSAARTRPSRASGAPADRSNGDDGQDDDAVRLLATLPAPLAMSVESARDDAGADRARALIAAGWSAEDLRAALLTDIPRRGVACPPAYVARVLRRLPESPPVAAPQVPAAPPPPPPRPSLDTVAWCGECDESTRTRQTTVTVGGRARPTAVTCPACHPTSVHVPAPAA